MHLALIDAPQSATGTDAATIPYDRKLLQHFILANIAELKDLSHEAGKYRLFCTTPDCIIGKLFDNLHRYGGPPIEAAFLEWARRFVSQEARRYSITAQILADHNDLIHKAIHECLWTSAIDLAVEHEDIYWEIVFLIFCKASALAKKGKAKLSTRVYSLVKKHIYLYHNTRNAKRRRLVQHRWNELRCEHFSEEELAAMRTAEADDAPYDPGYAEAAISMV